MSQIIETKSTGQAVGRSMMVGGLASFAFAVIKQNYPVPVTIGCAAIGGGLWLYNKLYLSDPKARAEYLEQLKKQPFSESLRNFRTFVSGGTAIENILAFATARDLTLLLNEEVGTADRRGKISIVVTLYGLKNTKELLKVGCITDNWLKLRFENECTTICKNNFTKFWDNCKGLLPEMKSTLPQGVVSTLLLREMFDAEFDWVSADGQLIPSAPVSVERDFSSVETTTSSKATTSGDVWRAVSSFGQFAQQELAVTRQRLRVIVETCPFALNQGTTVERCVNEGLFSLHSNGYLSSHFVEGKLSVELGKMSLSTASLQDVADRCRLRDLLMQRIIRPHVVQQLFRSGIPTSEPWFSGVNTQNNIVEFVSYWRSVMETFPELVPSQMQYDMAEAYRYFKEGERGLYEDAKRARERNEREAKREVEELERKRKRSGSKPFTDKERAQEISKRVTESGSVPHHKIEGLKKNIHSTFCRNVRNSYSSGYDSRSSNHNVNVNLGCANQ